MRLAANLLVSALVSVLVASSCGGEPDPAPTVATAEPIRGTFTVEREGHATKVVRPTRVEREAQVSTADGGRGVLRLDTGAWVLLDDGTEAKVELGKLTLGKGRLWVDATRAEETTIETGAGTLAAEGATFAVTLDRGAAQVYCSSGEVTYRSEGGSGRLQQGESVRLQGRTAASVEPERMWDDWTGGLADPTPRSELGPAYIGNLSGRRLDEKGIARTPLPVRGHDVRVQVRGDLAVTEVVQTFFNARSDQLEGEWILRLPRGAIVQAFAVDLGPGFVDAAVNAVGGGSGYELSWVEPSYPQSRLVYDAPDRLRARVYPIDPGASVRVKIVYTEWLERRGDMRTYVYPMASDTEPPLIGEFVLRVDTREARAGAYRAGMGAVTERAQVVLRRSDFRPHADFHLDLIDAEAREEESAAVAYVVEAPETSRGETAAEGDEDYVLFEVPTAELADEVDGAPPPLELAILLDVSGATDPEDLELARAVVESILRQLPESDRVAIRLADVRAHVPPGAPQALGASSGQNDERILQSLTRVDLGGATDLGQSFRDAAAVVAGKPRGAVLYLGDGLPTTGALDATALRQQLATIESPPRFFALGIGDGANVDLLRALFGDQALAVRERTEASRAVMHVLAEAARPTLRGVTVDLGPTIERVFPRPPVTSPDDVHLRFVGRMRGSLPETIRVRGKLDGRAFDRTLDVARDAPGSEGDEGDVRKRWATSRLAELLDEDAGREAIVELGVRFGIVTPWTSFVVGLPAGQQVPPVTGFDVDPLELAYGIGGGGTRVEVAQLGGDAGWRRRARRLDAEPVTLPESTWSSRVDETVVGAATEGDGGLGRAAVMRALEGGERGPRGCYERKLTLRPDLSGQMQVSVEVDGAGAVRNVALGSSSLGDRDVEDCVLTEVRGVRYPVTGSTSTVTVLHTYVFEMPTRPIGVRRHCSDASRQALETRRALWRERLAANHGVHGALSVWREAMSNCELGDWRARRTLLDQMLRHVGSVAAQIQLYRAFRGDSTVGGYLRRAILRNVRTPEDVMAVREGLGLEVPVDWAFFSRLWNGNRDPQARLRLVRRWLDVIPFEMDLRLRLLMLLEQTGRIAEAKRLARELRADPLADAKVRTAVGEFWLRQDDENEARRVFSEIVEHAPLDSWARQRLGDLYRAHGWANEAYREYQTLAKLRPGEPSVLLLLARAAAGAGRIDEALRLEQRLSESVDPQVDEGAATYARLWTQVRLARLWQEARDDAGRATVRQRQRSTGALRSPPDLLVALSWAHPEDAPELHVKYPSTTPEVGWERAPLQGGEHGIEAIKVRERETGDYLFEVRRTERDRIRDLQAELMIIVAPGSPDERVHRQEIRLTREERALRFRLGNDHSLTRVPIPPNERTPTPPPPR